MSSAESRPTPDHKIQLSHTAGVVQPAGSKAKQGPNTTIASQTESLLAPEKRAHATNSDCEERERNEVAFQLNEERFRQIVDTIPGLVSTMSATGEVQLLNRQVLEYFGKTTEELKNWITSDAIHPDDLPRVIETWKREVETGQPQDLELRQRRADGVYRWFQSRARPCAGYGRSYHRLVHIND